MFERAEVRRTGRAVSFTLAALAHAALLLAAVFLVRRQVDAEPPVIVVDVHPPRWPGLPPPGAKGTPSGKETHPTRKRPPPKLVDLEHLKPPPPPDLQPAPEMDPPDETAPIRSEEGSSGIERPGPGGTTDPGNCIGSGCGSTSVRPPATDLIVLQPGVVKPRALCDPAAPTMPEQARIMGITGAVAMRYVVETDGSVSRMELRNSDAPPVLVEAVRTWLERCRFKPGIARGQDARIQIDQSFVFKLR